jgi:hypothetical protein
VRYDRSEFEGAVREARSIAQVCRHLGLRVAGGNYKTIRRCVDAMGLDTSHWTGKGHLRGRRHGWAVSMPLELVLTSPTPYRGSGTQLKKRLLDAGLLADVCRLCGGREWHGRKLSLHLDHTNGNHDDNRIENLRLLCPNCHSLTETYCGRNKGKRSRRRAETNETPSGMMVE